MQKLTVLFSIFFSFSLFAQNGPVNPASTRSNGVANASVAFNDINSLFNNQAGLANLQSMSILLSGQETFDAPYSPYSDNLGGGFAIPVSLGALGLNVHYFGATDIRQTKIGLTYARKLMETLSIGAQLDMVNTKIPLNEKSNLFTFEAGLQYQAIEKLLLGIHLYNPVKLEIIENEFLPTILRVGGTYSFSKTLLVHAELEKDFDLPFVFKSGAESELIDNLWFRIGFQSEPTTFNCGVGYLFKNGIRFDIAAYYQKGLDLTSSSVLRYSGVVPSFGLGYDFTKK